MSKPFFGTLALASVLVALSLPARADGCLSQGEARLFMGTAHYRAHLKTAGPQVIWYNLDGRAEVDALHARWQAAGAKVDPLRSETPHKLHEFLAFDPDGNILRVFYDYGWEEREGGK